MKRKYTHIPPIAPQDIVCTPNELGSFSHILVYQTTSLEEVPMVKRTAYKEYVGSYVLHAGTIFEGLEEEIKDFVSRDLDRVVDTWRLPRMQYIEDNRGLERVGPRDNLWM